MFVVFYSKLVRGRLSVDAFRHQGPQRLPSSATQNLPLKDPSLKVAHTLEGKWPSGLHPSPQRDRDRWSRASHCEGLLSWFPCRTSQPPSSIAASLSRTPGSSIMVLLWVMGELFTWSHLLAHFTHVTDEDMKHYVFRLTSM